MLVGSAHPTVIETGASYELNLTQRNSASRVRYAKANAPLPLYVIIRDLQKFM
jgi:hypothetical protein